MINVRELEITIGARVLMSGVNFQVSKGDKVGLVGRNGAGKTTLTKVIAGDFQPSNGNVERIGEIGYLPQDPRTGDLEELASDRILNARGLGTILKKLEATREQMGSVDEAGVAKLIEGWLPKAKAESKAEDAALVSALTELADILGADEY